MSFKKLSIQYSLHITHEILYCQLIWNFNELALKLSVFSSLLDRSLDSTVFFGFLFLPPPFTEK